MGVFDTVQGIFGYQIIDERPETVKFIDFFNKFTNKIFEIDSKTVLRLSENPECLEGPIAKPNWLILK